MNLILTEEWELGHKHESGKVESGAHASHEILLMNFNRCRIGSFHSF